MTKAVSIPVANERVKYTATFINTIAAGAIVAGFVAPLATIVVGGQTGWPALFSFVWIPLGAALHFIVRRLLLRLREDE